MSFTTSSCSSSHREAPTTVELGPDAGAGAAIIELRPGGKVQARVLDSDGNAVTGAAIQVISASGRAANALRSSLRINAEHTTWTTRRDGTVLIERLTPGLYRAAARKGAVRTLAHEISVKEGETTELTLLLR